MEIKNAIFLDRDGTLNKGIVKENVDNFKLRPPHNPEELHVFEDISYLKSFLDRYHLFIVTNQPDIKKGHQTKEFNEFINSSILKKINITKIYTCFCLETNPGCECYKPSPGMILNAIKEYNIEIKGSYFVGDTWRDVGLCKNTNMTSILMDRGFYGNMKNDFLQKNLTPDHIINSFAELKNIIK
tara:strand:- start:610 stop:1164 length:555 start_codon:yes stop_codon:yes gene_type:complete